jgi:hypothetical protein
LGAFGFSWLTKGEAILKDEWRAYLAGIKCFDFLLSNRLNRLWLLKVRLKSRLFI